MRRTILCSIALCCALVSASCSDAAAPGDRLDALLPADPPSKEGTVSSVGVSLYGGRAINYAVMNLDPGHSWPVAWIYLGDKVVRQVGAGYRVVSVDSIVPGVRLSVWTDGIEMRSNPPQYFATQVLVH